MKKIFLIILFFLNSLSANISDYFPKLDGRVIDKVDLLTTTTKTNLNTILHKHEQESSNQIVVVILDSLNGYEIDEFTYQLGRHWGIGQKQKNNGVILLISMEERKIRIEVGYGLEGALTDKIAYEIINYTLKPNFKMNNFDNGVLEAINEIIKVIKGEYQSKKEEIQITKKFDEILVAIYFIIIFVSAFLNTVAKELRKQLFYKISKSTKISSFFGFFSLVWLQSYTSYYHLISILISLLLFIFYIKTSKNVDFDKLDQRESNNDGSNFGRFSSSSKRSSGGFSARGGSFGGGGASGGW